MVTKIFIDGEHGTTGLQIRKRIEQCSDLELLSIPYSDRHKIGSREEYLNQADVAILCLPEDTAREAVQLLQNNTKIRIIDSSTAHRVAPGWVYGFPEMTMEQKKRIQSARYVSNPGCYATGVIGLIRPLRESGLLSAHYPISINAISGYTGGGKKLIARMQEKSQREVPVKNYFSYGLNLQHKHIPEIKVHGQINRTPIFLPSVGRFPQGMLVNIPLHRSLLEKSATCSNLREIFNAYYNEQNTIFVASEEETNMLTELSPEDLAHTDSMKLFVFSDKNEEIFNLCALLDNLGKGASGAAIQNLNLMLSKK